MPFGSFEVHQIKPQKKSRIFAADKLRSEGEAILEFLKSDDELVLFDERGKSLTSEKFAKEIERLQNSSKKRVVFLIGGAFGVSDAVKARAQYKLSLAPFVMNHLVAEIVALEQLYRSFTILKNLPYHNGDSSEI